VCSAKCRCENPNTPDQAGVAEQADIKLPIHDRRIWRDAECSTQELSVRNRHHEQLTRYRLAVGVHRDAHRSIREQLPQRGVDINCIALEDAYALRGFEYRRIEPESTAVDEGSAFCATDVHSRWFVALDESGYFAGRAAFHTECLGEVVARSKRDDCKAAPPPASHDGPCYSGTSSVTSDRDDGIDTGFERGLRDGFFVTGSSCLYHSPDVDSPEGCGDIRDPRSGTFTSGRRVDDDFD
jgi:hypothetical protein